MKKFVSILIAVIVLIISSIPAAAQLGNDDRSQITIQNISGGEAQVTVQFVDEAGTSTTPTCLNSSSPCNFTNPFTLADGESKQIVTANVPDLTDGRYAAVVSSTGQVVAMAGLASDNPAHFNGTYAGFSNGGNPVYIPSVNFNHSGTYGMVSVMNLGDGATDITLEITCTSGDVGTLTANDVPKYSSHTFVLKNETPTGFTGSTICQGSGKLTASPSQPLAAVNAQNKPAVGNTLVFEGAPNGYATLYLPQLQVGYFDWNSVINIRKLNSGNTTVTVDYGDAEPSDTCNLTDAIPSCQLVLKVEHPTTGRFSAVVTSSPSNELQVQVGNTKAGHATQGAFANGYIGFSSGTSMSSVPAAQKRYFGWSTAINCQNISSTPTELQYVFQGGYAAYNPGVTLNQYDSYQVHTVSTAALNTLLPDGYYGGVTVTALASGAEIVCAVGNGNQDNNNTTPGDWNNMYNAPNR